MKSRGWVLFVMLLATVTATVSWRLAADTHKVLADGGQWGNKKVAETSASLPA